MNEPLTLDRERFDAVVFDLDGVITDTASVHFAAWKRLFDDFLAQRSAPAERTTVGSAQLEPFTHDDYVRFVDGKPRYDGARDFLLSRGIVLPEGTSDDPPGDGSVRALGNRKDEYFVASLAGRVRPYEGAVSFVRRLQEAGFGTAVISASRNAKAVLEMAGLGELFPVRIDGIVAEARGLSGKPSPDIFLAAVAALNSEPARTAIVEDALAGVEAGRSGGFGLVVGVDGSEGSDRAQALLEHGADVVVEDLGRVEVRGSA